VKLPKPRNPVHGILAAKRGGPHRKGGKALRAKARLETEQLAKQFFPKD
jgi:hypothetical protein